jgi:phage-related protein
MSSFPTLKTGAVLQYPAEKEVRFATTVVRFLDGSEQRYRGYQTKLRRWIVRLDLSDQAELHLFREFFRIQAGEGNSFTFTDPWDGAQHTNCSIDGGAMTEQLMDEMKGRTSLVVRENRG